MATKKAEQTKRVVYVSFNQIERDTLRQVGWRERWLYMELKWLANFKTGEVGSFRKQQLTYTELAKQVNVPVSQGCAGEVIDGKEASRLLGRLQKAGLVGEIATHSKGGLRFALPLSPIKNVAAVEASQDQPSEERLPEIEVDQVAGEADDDWDTDDCPAPLSILTSSNNINTFFNTASNDGAEESSAPRRPGKNPKPILLETTTPGAITIARIKGLLKNASFAFVSTSDSERFYATWIQQGFTELDLLQAIDEVKASGSPTPMAVDTKLRQQRVQQSKPRNGRGRVAL